MNYFDWVRQNWFTVVGIIIILCMVWWDVATVQTVIKEKVDACIEHYETEIAAKCSMGGVQSYNLSDYNFTLTAIS